MKPSILLVSFGLILFLGAESIFGQGSADFHRLPNFRGNLNIRNDLLWEARLARLEIEFKDKTILFDQSVEKIANLEHHMELAVREIAQLKKKLDDCSIISNAQHPLIIPTSPKASIPRTCYEIKSSQPGYTQGTYIIDPSGLGRDPITVFCDPDGKTLISHDTEASSTISSCVGADCYIRVITYDAKLEQIKALTSISSECRQSFRYECTVAPFEYNGVQYSYWKDAYGNVRDYWAGPKSVSHTCQCGIERNCLNVGITCNCDSLSSSSQVDSGFITDKEALPVTELHFGRNQLSGSSGRYTLGKLECSGRSTFSGIPTGCRDLYEIGHVLNGFFPVKNGNKIDMIYCDFSSFDEGIETRQGFIDVKSSSVHFYVQLSTSFSTLNTPIPFDIERLNVGRAMNIGTGIFTAPQTGIYYFTFSCIKVPSTAYMHVSLRLNGVHVAFALSATYNGHETAALDSTLKLNVGDQISLVITDGAVYDYEGGYYTNFSGFLLEED